VTYYRLYFMSDGRIRDAVEIHAADDAAAMREATQRVGSRAGELWCRGRRVATLLAA
jgi:hypothetical protein